MSCYLVTGGAGFIGSHLCDALIARGHAVRVLDDLSTGQRANLHEAVELMVADIADPAAVLQATQGIDGCFHLAAIASVERGINDWAGAHRTNLTGTITMFDAIRRHGTRVPVVYASSAAVYGDSPAIPIRETAERRPLSAYGADKSGCELHAITASHVHGIPTVGLRFFNIYGPRQDPRSPYSGVISIFCERVRNGAQVLIHGDGAQTRDFVYVGDAVGALLAAMTLRPDVAVTINVCTGQATSILELAQLVGKLAGKWPNLNHTPARCGDIRHSLGDPSAMQRILGLGATVPLQDGLLRLLAHAAKSPVLKSTLEALVLPPVCFLYLAIVGLLTRRRHPRGGRALAGISLAGLLLLSVPLVPNLLIVALEQDLPLTPPPGVMPQAIVVLGGDLMRTKLPPYSLPGYLTLDRLRAAAALYRRTGLPILVSGGTVQTDRPPIARIMADSLRDDFQVPVTWVEDTSFDTWQNAAFSAAILKPRGIHSVYVVTQGWHMRRAMIAFRRTGLIATAVPTSLDTPFDSIPWDIPPRAAAWLWSYYALHEWIGCAWYAFG